MEAVQMSSILQGECVTSSETLSNLDETIDSICKMLTSRESRLLDTHHVGTLADDDILVQINFLISLFQAGHCKRLQELQQRLIANNKLFDSLVQFLADQSYLTAYSACKALVGFLIHDTTRSSKFKFLAGHCLKSHQSVANLGKSHYHRILLTFDLFRLLCKKRHLTKNKLSCPCGEIQNSMWKDQEADMLPAMSSLILLLEPFEVCFKERRDGHYGYVDTKNAELLICHDMKCLKNMKSKELDMLILSFLKMIKAFLKGSCKEHHPKMLLEIVNFLVKFLKEGWQNSRQALKTCFDILAIVLQLHFESNTTETKGLQKLQMQTASSLCELMNREWLNNLPHSNGPLGFGGVNFMETCSHQMGDLTLLRRLTKLIFISVQLITEQVADFTEEVVLYVTSSACSLRHLKTFIESLNTDPSSGINEDWINQLFADEDDMMVSVLFHALQIYTKIVRASANSHLDVTAMSAQRELQQLLCPHRLFWNYLKLLDFDYSVLLDLLISCETNFLEYFTSYLHLVKVEWDKWCEILRVNCKGSNITEQAATVDSEEFEIPPKRMKRTTHSPSSNETTLSVCSGDEDNLNQAGNPLSDNKCSLENNARNESGASCDSFEANPGLDRVLSVLIRLRMSLERLHKRKMFPYPISPLLRLLQDLEALYERQ